MNEIPTACPDCEHPLVFEDLGVGEPCLRLGGASLVDKAGNEKLVLAVGELDDGIVTPIGEHAMLAVWTPHGVTMNIEQIRSLYEPLATAARGS